MSSGFRKGFVNEVYKCEFCGRTFTGRRSISKHIQKKSKKICKDLFKEKYGDNKENLPWNKKVKCSNEGCLNLVWPGSETGLCQKCAVKNFWKDPNYRERVLKTRNKSEVKKKYSEAARRQCLNGHAVYMNKCIKNPSKLELKLREIVKELFPDSISQYKVLNYALDNAIIEPKIAIEFDGWYHFDCQHDIDYHKKRQQEIENEGWKFIRYNIFQIFPSKKQVEEDTQKVIVS